MHAENTNNPRAAVNRSTTGRILSLAVMCFIAIFFVTRTEGFENIRAVQFLLIFVAGALVGMAVGILRESRLVKRAE